MPRLDPGAAHDKLINHYGTLLHNGDLESKSLLWDVNQRPKQNLLPHVGKLMCDHFRGESVHTLGELLAFLRGRSPENDAASVYDRLTRVLRNSRHREAIPWPDAREQGAGTPLFRQPPPQPRRGRRRRGQRPGQRRRGAHSSSSSAATLTVSTSTAASGGEADLTGRGMTLVRDFNAMAYISIRALLSSLAARNAPVPRRLRWDAAQIPPAYPDASAAGSYCMAHHNDRDACEAAPACRYIQERPATRGRPRQSANCVPLDPNATSPPEVGADGEMSRRRPRRRRRGVHDGQNPLNPKLREESDDDDGDTYTMKRLVPRSS